MEAMAFRSRRDVVKRHSDSNGFCRRPVHPANSSASRGLGRNKHYLSSQPRAAGDEPGHEAPNLILDPMSSDAQLCLQGIRKLVLSM
ncbi:hypothetical protein EYF80_043771 [Liparis tanakae]|uniref:Uncharacterized protein n=1 Tax=Liparis tanakae TaxID=230148 RepID=A0A4Z2FXL2_9TELE|nr:hypothetical protein EYF80_043771 [Liparis tanakae]